jgi:GNAT superfamily N-acetyltransferase
VSTHPTELARAATGERIPATLHDALVLDDLFDADKTWAPEKIEIMRQLTNLSVPRSAWPQSLHWSWAWNAVAMKPYATGPLSSYRLLGVSAEDRWQGLLFARCVGYHTRIAPTGRDLVYIDLVETAPWNWRVPQISQQPQLKGIGSQLLELAVRWSADLGFRGRIGLHSLPQADTFYRDSCGMNDFGSDSGHQQNLRYFELDETRARPFLEGA